MLATIEESELKLLAYLHEHVGRQGVRIWLDPRPVLKSLGIGQEQFARDSSALADHGFAGVRKINTEAVPHGALQYSAVFLTGAGENYMRKLETAVGRKLTVAAVKESWKMGTGAIISMATQLLADLDNRIRTLKHGDRPLHVELPGRWRLRAKK